MRNFTLILLFLFVGIGVSNELQAQALYSPRKNIVKVNPVSLLFLRLSGSYERVLDEKTSFQLGGFYSGFSMGGVSWKGIGVSPQVRIYFKQSKPKEKKAPEGFYVSPFGNLQVLTFRAELPESDQLAKASVSSMGGGILGGYQWLLGRSEKITLDLFAGPQYDNTKVVLEGNASSDLFGQVDKWDKGLTLCWGAAVGIAF